ncbi:endonuclease V-like isoform X4 [Acanthaster planci]|uniref:Endonuclease V-like isoform X4 n=1 Tax=Acanthaster planci TaxID=133434 RepID=A0A8B7YGI1_ACAPL|nr:endonuclease V-like isoform X4 [Acanthaster planci]
MQLVLQPVGQKCKILRAVAQEHITAMTAHDASRVMANVPVQTDEVFEEIHKKWESEQQELKKKLVLENTESWQSDLDGLRCVGGVDVSFVKTSSTLACASLVVCDYPDLKVIYSDCELVHLDTPYIPGFLAFREVNFFLNLLHKLRDKEPNLMPQVILVDGNGILHPRGFGIASHLGVLSGIPCVGVAKTLMQVDGIAKNEQFAEKVAELGSGGDTFPLMTDSGQILGMSTGSGSSLLPWRGETLCGGDNHREEKLSHCTGIRTSYMYISWTESTKHAQ